MYLEQPGGDHYYAHAHAFPNTSFHSDDRVSVAGDGVCSSDDHACCLMTLYYCCAGALPIDNDHLYCDADLEIENAVDGACGGDALLAAIDSGRSFFWNVFRDNGDCDCDYCGLLHRCCGRLMMGWKRPRGSSDETFWTSLSWAEEIYRTSLNLHAGARLAAAWTGDPDDDALANAWRYSRVLIIPPLPLVLSLSLF